MDDDHLTDLRRRILLPFQVQRGSSVWAPWGKSGWSAVEVSKPSRKWAKGWRIKPATGERGSEAKVPMDRLLKRDQALKGKDKPEISPDEVFAHVPEKEPEPKKEEAASPAPTQVVKTAEPHRQRTEKEMRAFAKKIDDLLGLIDDDSTTDDW